MNTTAAWDMIKETFSDWSEDRAPRLAAALAYYTVFALAPLLIIVIAVASLLFDQAQVQEAIVGQIGGMIGQNGSEALGAMLEGARKPAAGIVATVIGIVTLVFAAGGVFAQLQDALNTIWEVQPKPGRGIMGTIKDRFLSLTMVLGIGFLLLVSLVISAALATFGKTLGGEQYEQSLFWSAVNFVLSFGITTLLFAMIFKFLPDAKVQWRDVWIGAVATAALFTIGKTLIGLYLGRAGTEFDLRRGRIAGRHPALGVLLGPNSVHGRRVHPSLRQALWLEDPAVRGCRGDHRGGARPAGHTAQGAGRGRSAAQGAPVRRRERRAGARRRRATSPAGRPASACSGRGHSRVPARPNHGPPLQSQGPAGA